MSRAHFRDSVLAANANDARRITPLSGASVALYQPGTTTPITDTIYAADTGAGTLTNPLTADADGVVEFWLERPQRVDLVASKAAYTSVRVTVDVAPVATERVVFNALEYGATGDGSTADTAGIQRAVDAARAASLSSTRTVPEVRLPGSNGGTCVGFYRVSSIDGTVCNNLKIVGDDVALYADLQTVSGKPVIDLSGSSNTKVEGITVHGEDTGGNAPAIKPTCALLVSEAVTAANPNAGNSNKCQFRRVGSLGWFSKAAVVVFGSTDGLMEFCAFSQYQDGQPVLDFDAVNSFGATSPYVTVPTDLPAHPFPRNTGEWTFLQCEFHDQFDRAAPYVASTIKSLMFHSAYNVRFFGGNVSNAGLRHVDYQGPCRNITFDGTQFYSDSGVQPPHIFFLNSMTLNGLSLDQCEYPPASTALIGGTTSTLAGLHLSGKVTSGGLASKLIAMTSPSTLADSIVQCDGLAVDVGAGGSILKGLLVNPGAITAGTNTATSV